MTFLQLPLCCLCIFLSIIDHYAPDVKGQELNEPSKAYVRAELGNRTIWWCPSGYGYSSFCPQPTDRDNYNWCCTWPYMGTWKPGCCPLAIPTGALVAVIIGATILLAIFTMLCCWACHFCPLHKNLYE